jgi:hypothetical protein
MAGATLLVACGDDTELPSETDAQTTTDAPSSSETSPPKEAGPDTAPPFDGGFQVETFDSVLATELCKALARCCYGSAVPAEGGVDGGSFDTAKCEHDYGRVGFEGSNGNADLRDGGKLVLDQVNADACIAKIKAMTCNLPGAEFKAIRTACFGAYSGSVAAGGACAQSIECKSNHFCKLPDDGGAGTCEALRPLNGNCGDFTSDPSLGDQACSYRAGGNTGNFCKFYDLTNGTPIAPADWKCEAATGAGTTCATSLWCEQTICNNSNTCVTPEKYFEPACSQFVIP